MTISQQTIDDLAGLTRDLGAAPAWQAVHRVLCELVCEVQRLDKLPSGDAPPQDCEMDCDVFAQGRVGDLSLCHYHALVVCMAQCKPRSRMLAMREYSATGAKGGDAPQEPSEGLAGGRDREWWTETVWLAAEAFGADRDALCCAKVIRHVNRRELGTRCGHGFEEAPGDRLRKRIEALAVKFEAEAKVARKGGLKSASRAIADAARMLREELGSGS